MSSSRRRILRFLLALVLSCAVPFCIYKRVGSQTGGELSLDTRVSSARASTIVVCPVLFFAGGDGAVEALYACSLIKVDFFAGGDGAGEALYACGVVIIALSKLRPRQVWCVPAGPNLDIQCNCIVLILCAQQVVKFPCGEQITVKFEQLQGYAKNFRWLSPQFEKLAAGQSDETWHCFLTIKPVLALGVVRSLGPNPEQMEAMCDHLDQYQPALSRDAVQIDSE